MARSAGTAATPDDGNRVDPSPSSAGPSAASTGDGNFECNICLELANDPVITLCGHLFCWSCLYRWLRLQSHCKECPVCKAGVEESKVIPLYGRGKASSDPRKRPVPDADDIPHRPAGQRPEAVRNQGNPGVGYDDAWGWNRAYGQGHPGMGLFGGAAPFATGHIGGLTFSAGFGLVPALFGLQFHTFPGWDGSYGHPPPHGGPMAGNGQAGMHPHQQQQNNQAWAEQQQQAFLSRLLMLLGILVMVFIIFL